MTVLPIRLGNGLAGALPESQSMSGLVNVELVLKYTDQSDGRSLSICSRSGGAWVIPTINTGTTDRWTGGLERGETIGGYGRHHPYAQNGRFWADLIGDLQTAGRTTVRGGRSGVGERHPMRAAALTDDHCCYSR